MDCRILHADVRGGFFILFLVVLFVFRVTMGSGTMLMVEVFSFTCLHVRVVRERAWAGKELGRQWWRCCLLVWTGNLGGASACFPLAAYAAYYLG